MNAARFRAGERIGITYHVASILGTWGFLSPTYFPSPADVTLGNDAMLELCEREPDRVRMFTTVNPNYTDHACAEIERCTARGAIGIKLLASRRADDPLLDPSPRSPQSFSSRCCITSGSTVRASGRRKRSLMARISRGSPQRHPKASFILAHIGGGGDYMHTFAAVRDVPNIYPDLSGSGVDRGMLDAAVDALGADRLLWGSDLTMCTGLAKLRALDTMGLGRDDIERIRWKNTARIFRPGSFPRCESASHAEGNSMVAGARA